MARARVMSTISVDVEIPITVWCHLSLPNATFSYLIFEVGTTNSFITRVRLECKRRWNVTFTRRTKQLVVRDLILSLNHVTKHAFCSSKTAVVFLSYSCCINIDQSLGRSLIARGVWETSMLTREVLQGNPHWNYARGLASLTPPTMRVVFKITSEREAIEDLKSGLDIGEVISSPDVLHERVCSLKRQCARFDWHYRLDNVRGFNHHSVGCFSSRHSPTHHRVEVISSQSHHKKQDMAHVSRRRYIMFSRAINDSCFRHIRER